MSRMLVLAAVPEPVGEAPARLLDLLLRRLGDPLEAARVVVDGVARGGTRVDIVAALGVVAADAAITISARLVTSGSRFTSVAPRSQLSSVARYHSSKAVWSASNGNV